MSETRKLTANEKAATFIGWAPECRFCGPCHGQGLKEHRDDPGFIHYCERHSVPVNHPMAAPDMDRPENYMRALEAVAERRLYVSITIYRAVGGSHYTGVWIKAEADPANCECSYDYECKHAWPKIVASAMNADAGEAAVATLAALYDAEHPEEV